MKEYLGTVFSFLKKQGEAMKIPCAERIPLIVTGLAFLQPALTNAQFYNLTLVATALVLGAKFLQRKCNISMPFKSCTYIRLKAATTALTTR